LAPNEAQQSNPKTLSGIEVKRVYSGEDAPRLQEDSGSFPYTRGIYPEMYRKRLWTIREYSGFGTSAETNKRLRFMLDQGQTGLSLAFDLPTQLGLDSDNPRSIGEIGRVGVAVSLLGDVQAIFRGIDLGKVSTSMTINSTAPMLFSMYAAAAEGSGVPKAEIRGTVQNDPIARHRPRGVFGEELSEVAPHQHKRLPHPRGRVHSRAGACLHLLGRNNLHQCSP
jgi:methylmalonyl-CoA mutase N-terminal domain/subunit